jgi:hypothetical protein
MLHSGTVVQYLTPSRDWGAHGTITGVLDDGDLYRVDLLPPRAGSAVWGRAHVVRVHDAPPDSDPLPLVRPGGTLPIPGLRVASRTRRRPLPHLVVGTLEEAAAVADWHPEYGPGGVPSGWTPIGEGEHRAVILSPSGVVYKVETASGRNRREHRTLRGLRQQGYGHAPASTVWSVRSQLFGAGRLVEVLAMPYLPNDGSEPVAPYPRAGVVDYNPENITVCRGQYWLIDASGL